ncbi:ABC transporter permease, partial [Micromonospora sp. M61]|nr:ABC transporter permease [Micromonospora sp. M61]
MTNPPTPQSGSPDKEPASEAQAAQNALGNTERAEVATEPGGPASKPEPEQKPSLGRLFMDNLWAANTFTVTLLSLVLAIVVG